MLLWIVLLNAALCVASGNVTRDVCKEQICSCNEIEGDVHIDCEKRSLTTLQHLTGPSSQFYHLLLHGNSLSRLFPNEFANFYNAVSLHLENNGLHDIVPGAFLGLQLVKRLHINNNKIRSFRKSTFLGLDDLEYLQADFNLLRDIDPAVFRDLNKLEVLILNDNLISALPINVFQHVPITHLDLRGNRIKTVPYEGVLEQIPGIAEVLLEDNPWDCNCELVSLKEWLENIPRNALIGRVICEAPTRLQGSDLNETSEAELCPSQSGGADTSLVAPPTQDQTSNPAAANPRPTPYKPSGNASGPPTPGGGSGHGAKSRSKSRENWQLKTKPTPVVTSMSGGREEAHNVTCPQPCTCKLVGSRQGLGVNCESKKIESLSNLKPKPLSAHELNMRENNIHAVKKNQLLGYTSLNLLDLGGNNIKVIDNGTFQNLSELRWLYLDKNYLDTLLAEMFIGLVNLEYLSLEYNDIQQILAGAFSHMPNLRVLFLNNNLLKSLPVDSFYGISLSKISLHNNYFTHLPVAGVLDQLNSIIQIDLHGNPWDCSCNIIPFKQWTEKLGADVIVSDLKCESPEEFWKRDFRYVRNDLMCPKLYDKISPTSLSKNSTYTIDSGTRPNSYIEPNRVSISVLVPGLLLVFVTSAFTVVGMLVFILRNRKRSKRREGNSSASEINSLQTVCDSSYWHSGAYHQDGGAHRGFDCTTHLSSTNDA